MPIGDLLAQISGEPSSTLSPSTLPVKRKANDDLQKPVANISRPRPPIANTARPLTQDRVRAPTLNTSMDRMRIVSNGGSGGRDSASSQAPVSKTVTPPVSASTSKAPPKKGSFAEILARGKAAQATLGPVGKIQHKKIEKRPTKKDIEDAKAQQAKNLQRGFDRQGSNGRPTKPGQGSVRDGKVGSKDVGRKAVPEPDKKMKKAATATTGYAGTARPKPGATRPASKISSRRDESRYENGGAYGRSSKRYNYASEEDDMDMEDDEQDYESDVSSDMEAAAFEVDEEEELAASIARREDAQALAEENRLKREKAERKKKLEAMAKKSRR